MSPQSYWWAATTCLLLGLALSSQSALSVKLTPDDQLSPDPFVDESPDQPPAIPSSSPPPAEGEGVVRGQFESGRTGGPASPRVNVFEQRKAALERVERTLAERHRALQLALAAATTGKRKVALVVDDPDGNLHAIGAAREHVQGAIRIAETSAESTSEEGATLSPAVVKAHQRNLTLRLVELERSRKHFGEELRKSERRQLARDVDRLSKDVGSRALHVINEKMDTVRKNVSRLIHDMEIDMEKRFLRGMNHSTQRLRGLVMGEVQTTVQRHSLEMKDGLAKRLRTSTSILLGRHLRDLKRDVGQELKTIIHDSVAHAASNISSFVVSSGNPEQKDLVTLENEARDNGITVFTKPHGGSPSDLAALKEAVEDAQSADKLIKGADAPQADGPDATATPGTIMNAGTGETAASGNGISTGAVAVDLDIAGKPRFEYTFHSPRGPEKWGHISEQYKTCAVGNRQSPVDVRFSSYFPKLKNVIVDPSMPSLEVRMPPMPPTKVINNGHSILVDVPGDGDAANKGSLVFNSSSGSGGGGGRHLADFVFHQFHIHVPGEHEVNGKPADMAIHLVFARTSQAPVAAEQANFTTAEARFSIIEVPFDVRPQGESFLDLLVDRLPQPPPLGAKTPQSTVDPQALPLDFQDALFGQKGADVARLASSEFYTYSGSATTPPCHEDVRWFIMKRILGISQSQLQRLAQVLPKTGNARPPQNHRWRSPPAIRTGGMTTEENADADGTAERELEEHALHPGDHGGSATAPGVVSGGAIGASAPANNRSVPMTKPENPRPPSSKEVAVARATPAPAPSRSLLVAPSPTPSPTPRKERPQLDKDTMLLEMMIAVSGVAKGHKTENEVTKTFGEILANVADVPQANVTIELIHTALPKRQRRGLLQQPGEADSETAGGFNVSVTIRVATTDVAKKVFQRVFERVKDGEITGQLKLMGINGIRAYAVEGPAEFEAEMAAERVNPHDSAGGASGSTGEQLSGASGAEAGASARNIVGMSGRSGASGGGPGEHDSGGASGQGGPSGNAEVTEAVQEVDTASKALQSLPESAMPKMERDMLTKALGKISKDAKENTLKPEDLKGEEAQAAENLMETVKQRIATKQKEHDAKIGANATQASRDMDLAKRRKDDDNAERTAYNLMKDAGVPTEAIPKDTRESMERQSNKEQQAKNEAQEKIAKRLNATAQAPKAQKAGATEQMQQQPQQQQQQQQQHQGEPSGSSQQQSQLGAMKRFQSTADAAEMSAYAALQGSDPASQAAMKTDATAAPALLNQALSQANEAADYRLAGSAAGKDAIKEINGLAASLKARQSGGGGLVPGGLGAASAAAGLGGGALGGAVAANPITSTSPSADKLAVLQQALAASPGAGTAAGKLAGMLGGGPNSLGAITALSSMLGGGAGGGAAGGGAGMSQAGAGGMPSASSIASILGPAAGGDGAGGGAAGLGGGGAGAGALASMLAGQAGGGGGGGVGANGRAALASMLAGQAGQGGAGGALGAMGLGGAAGNSIPRFASPVG